MDSEFINKGMTLLNSKEDLNTLKENIKKVDEDIYVTSKTIINMEKHIKELNKQKDVYDYALENIKNVKIGGKVGTIVYIIVSIIAFMANPPITLLGIVAYIIAMSGIGVIIVNGLITITSKTSNEILDGIDINNLLNELKQYDTGLSFAKDDLAILKSFRKDIDNELKKIEKNIDALDLDFDKSVTERVTNELKENIDDIVNEGPKKVLK